MRNISPPSSSRRIRQEKTLHNHRYENLKSYITDFIKKRLSQIFEKLLSTILNIIHTAVWKVSEENIAFIFKVSQAGSQQK
jgi:predicted metal-dependent hydrolase